MPPGAHFRESLPGFPLAHHEQFGAELGSDDNPGRLAAVDAAHNMAAEHAGMRGDPRHGGVRDEIMEALMSRYREQEPWITRAGAHGDRPQVDLAEKPPHGSPQALLDALYGSGQLGDDFRQSAAGGHPQVVVQSPPGDYESQRLQEEPRAYGLPPDSHYRE